MYVCAYKIIHRLTVSLYHNSSVWLGSKPGWLYISWISYSRAIIILSVNEGIFYVYILHICYQLLECSIHEKSFSFTYMWQLAIPYFCGGIYIVIHRQTVLLYHNSLSLYIYIYIYNIVLNWFMAITSSLGGVNFVILLNSARYLWLYIYIPGHWPSG